MYEAFYGLNVKPFQLNPDMPAEGMTRDDYVRAKFGGGNRPRQIYQAVAENMASEQSARMVAMKAASDNAKKVIEDLQLTYNKARQAAITKELSEIVAGAAAV